MSGPLAGVRVLDFTRLLPGPFGSMALADLGAEVVRVEAVKLPDLMVVMPPMDGDVSAAHRQINRGKKSIVVDLKHARGPEVVKKLVKDFDILLEQFRPGVMDRLGVGYQDLKAANPGLIYCSITGYGQTGPYRDRAGHDLNYLAMSGIMSYTGRREGGPLPLGIQVADQCAGGLNAVIAVLAALHHRGRSGEGQCIDISMTDGAMHLSGIHAMSRLAGGQPAPGYENMFLNGGSYYDCYETADGGYLSVGGLEPQFYAAMVKAMGREDLLNYHMSSGERGQHLKQELGKEFKQRTRAEWEKIFAPVDACVEPVLTVDEMLEHPLTKAREMVIEVPKPDGSKQRQIGNPYKFSGTPCECDMAGRTPGSDSGEILAQAGFSSSEIEELVASGAVKQK